MKLRHVKYSVLLHICFVAMFAISVPKFAKERKLELDSAPVIAQAVSDEELNKALKQIANEEERAAKEQEKTNKKLAELRAKKSAEEKSLAKLKKDLEKAQAEKDKLNKQKEQAKKDLASEQARLKAEQERLASTEKEAKQQQIAQALAAKKQTEKEIDIYASMIQARIRNNWVKAYGIPDGLDCQIEVVTGNSGDIERIKIVKSSGNAAFDRSAEAAVLKSSPLPLPQDASARKEFRQFKFTFAPEVA